MTTPYRQNAREPEEPKTTECRWIGPPITAYSYQRGSRDGWFRDVEEVKVPDELR